MNTTHMHLVLNHLPIIFPMVGILLLSIGIITKSDTSKKNSYLIFTLGAIATIATMYTGEAAEETVEHLQGINENFISIHEEAAETFAWASYFLGILSAGALFLQHKKHSFSQYMPYLIAITSFYALFLAQKAGNSGGQIRHTEIRTGAVINGEHSKNDASESEKKESDEDE